MFRRLPDLPDAPLNFTFDGQHLTARKGDSVAAALLVAGVRTSRTTPVSGASRAPYCMMGVCFECLVKIDGIGNRQACLIPIEEGMAIETQSGARAIESEYEIGGATL